MIVHKYREINSHGLIETGKSVLKENKDERVIYD